MIKKGKFKEWMSAKHKNKYWALSLHNERHPQEVEEIVLLAMMKRYPSITDLFETEEGDLVIAARGIGCYCVRDFYEICALGIKLGREPNSYSQIAKDLSIPREEVKRRLYCYLYGSGPAAVLEQSGEVSREEAELLLARFHKAYPLSKKM